MSAMMGREFSVEVVLIFCVVVSLCCAFAAKGAIRTNGMVIDCLIISFNFRATYLNLFYQANLFY
jgi:hypothetical protein